MTGADIFWSFSDSRWKVDQSLSGANSTVVLGNFSNWDCSATQCRIAARLATGAEMVRRKARTRFHKGLTVHYIIKENVLAVDNAKRKKAFQGRQQFPRVKGFPFSSLVLDSYDITHILSNPLVGFPGVLQ